MDNIMKEETQFWLKKEIPPSQGNLSLNQVGCPQSPGGEVSESRIAPRGKPISDPSYNPNASSSIPIPEDHCNILDHTPRLGESLPRRISKKLYQPKISSVNLDEYSSMPSVKFKDTYEKSSAALRLPLEKGINQVGDSSKISNSRS